jgi:5'-methylthioadenosine phosphorylase
MSRIGIIGGSGLYNIDGIKKVKEVALNTPFGKPSDKFIIGELSGKEVVFLPRHGKGHRLLPSEVNYRANVYGMKKLGVTKIISVTACGSLREDFKPLDFVLPDQFVDRTNQARKMTFFGNGIVGHIAFGDPVCHDTRDRVYNCVKSLGLNVHNGGNYINMEGPAFSTKAESKLYRSWGMDIIGMTNMSEAKLAREAQICYTTLASITDYDCWYESKEEVSMDMVSQNFRLNVENSKKVIKKMIQEIPVERACNCADALKYAFATDPKVIPAKTKKDLKLIIGKYIK